VPDPGLTRAGAWRVKPGITELVAGSWLRGWPFLWRVDRRAFSRIWPARGVPARGSVSGQPPAGWNGRGFSYGQLGGLGRCAWRFARLALPARAFLQRVRFRQAGAASVFRGGAGSVNELERGTGDRALLAKIALCVGEARDTHIGAPPDCKELSCLTTGTTGIPAGFYASAIRGAA